MRFWQKAGVLAVTMMALTGCMHRSNAVGGDGRPHAPSNQPVVGASEGEGPVGQPQGD